MMIRNVYILLLAICFGCISTPEQSDVSCIDVTAMQTIVVREIDFNQGNMLDVLDTLCVVCFPECQPRNKWWPNPPQVISSDNNVKRASIEFKRDSGKVPLVTLKAKNASLYSILIVVSEICRMDTDTVMKAFQARRKTLIKQNYGQASSE